MVETSCLFVDVDSHVPGTPPYDHVSGVRLHLRFPLHIQLQLPHSLVNKAEEPQEPM
jgi:hypothetical protein